MILALLLPLATSSAFAGDFVDTWVTSAFEEDNALAGPEAYSPSPNFVTRGNNTFFENYETRFSDDVSMTHLVIYRKDEGYNPRWSTEAALVLRMNPVLDPDDSDPSVDLEDDGSYVRVIRKLGDRDDQTISATGYVIDANRFRLGYSYDLTWGGRDIYAFDPSAAPGVRLQYQRGATYVFAGLKTAVGDYVTVTGDKRNQAYYGGLFGAGGEIGKKVRLEGGVGNFQQGQLTNVDSVTNPLYNDPINALGGCFQAGFRTGDNVDFMISNELKLYRNGPEFIKETYISHSDVEGVGFVVQGEANLLTHNLIDPAKTDSSVIEKALAGDVQARLMFGKTLLGADAVYKDLPYIVFNIPGITSGYAISYESLAVKPEMYVRFLASHWFEEAHLAPQLGVGYLQPASYKTAQGAYVQYSERDKEKVPTGQDPTAVLSTVASLQWDISRSVVGVAEVMYTLDNNLSDYVITEGDTGTRIPAPADERNKLGFNLMFRARF